MRYTTSNLVLHEITINRDRDIFFGQPKVAGNKVAEFFTPSVECIVNAVVPQTRLAHYVIYSLCLKRHWGSFSMMISSLLY